MESRWCTRCGSAFEPRPQVPHQTYCSKPLCQKERRRLWQQLKRLSDPDYSENQSLAQRAWVTRNAQYWRKYREEHPDYVAKNRAQQKERSSATRKAKVAKSDSSKSQIPLESGVYRLSVLALQEIAKSDVWLVQLTLHEPD
jgi:hypothetical protein